MTKTGTVQKIGLEGGLLALVTDAGETFELLDPPAALRPGVRAKVAETRAEKTKPPRISPWGLLFTDPRPLLATRKKWLRLQDSNLRPGD